MTPAEHASEAERILGTLKQYDANRWKDTNEAGRANAIAEAQVHATLAVLAAIGEKS